MLVVIFLMDKLFIEVNTIIYYILIGPAIAALGNYILIRIQIRKSENKIRNWYLDERPPDPPLARACSSCSAKAEKGT